MGEEGGKTLLQHDGGAVAVELGGVLPGIAVRAGENHGQALIDGFAVRAQEGSENHGPGGMGGEGAAVPGAEHGVRRGEGRGAGDAQHPDGGDAGPGGNGGNGIHGFLLSGPGSRPGMAG